MEKIGLTSSSPLQPRPPNIKAATGARLAPGAAVARPVGGFEAGYARFMGTRSIDMFSDLMSFGEFGDGRPLGSGTDGLMVDTMNSTPESGDESVSDYEALMNANGPERVEHPTGGTPQFLIPSHAQRSIESSSSAQTSDKQAGLQVDQAAAEHFSITHPRWGLLDVESLRQGARWDVIVRCGDADTQNRIRSRESEFRQILSRDFGVTLELSVQPAMLR